MIKKSPMLDTVFFIVIMLAIVFVVALLFTRTPHRLHWMSDLITSPAYAHEHMQGENPEQARVIEFYRTWQRPKGVFSVEHRERSCCYAAGDYQDCFPVLAIRKSRKDGVWEVYPDLAGTSTKAQITYNNWYRLDTKVDEDLQPDPRESPDGRSHVCISEGAQVVVCYVPGSGQ
jgi:hypothetical protein